MHRKGFLFSCFSNENWLLRKWLIVVLVICHHSILIYYEHYLKCPKFSHYPKYNNRDNHKTTRKTTVNIFLGGGGCFFGLYWHPCYYPHFERHFIMSLILFSNVYAKHKSSFLIGQEGRFISIIGPTINY